VFFILCKLTFYGELTFCDVHDYIVIRPYCNYTVGVGIMCGGFSPHVGVLGVKVDCIPGNSSRGDSQERRS